VRLLREGLVIVLMAVGVTICGLAGSAQAEIAFTPCGESNEFACGHLTVPLDPTGTQPGTMTLALRRHRASVGEARTAIIALAGGPGQPALSFAGSFAELLGPIAATRDLIVFDQRGIGLSDPLSCHAFEHPGSYSSFGPLIAACGAQLGATRSLYTTADTVADVEAIRRAGGYEKLVLYGTSYGTKVAELYAQTYPSHVEGLVLDSVVTPNGPDPLERPTFEAVPRILRQMCAKGACASITANPVADLARVLRQMSHGPLRGRLIDGEGRPHEVSVSPADLIGILLAGDFSRSLRAEFITTLAAAARGDSAPVTRMLSTAAKGEEEGEDFDGPLYYATTCEEQDFPFSRSADPATRLAQARTAAGALPASAFAPFTAAEALQSSDIEACAHWPYNTPAPPLDTTPFPSVPTLIISGAGDLRTPTANARELAAQIPGAHLLAVPYTGHSVLGEEPTACAREALVAMFAGTTIHRCPPAPPPASLRPPPLPPLGMSLVAPERGYEGLSGRTLHAIRLTLEDMGHELALQASSSGELSAAPTLRTGGLRAGWAELTSTGLSLHGLSYVPGLMISGSIKDETADLLITGPSAAHGTLRLGRRDALVGTLGGRHVELVANRDATAAIVARDAQASSNSRAGGSAGADVARNLAELLGGLHP
jgi:pimeloyl-ACP methyl ester carboxylesterase